MVNQQVKTREHEEAWFNPNDGKVWYFITDSRGRDRHLAVRGKETFRITTDDRELCSSGVFDPSHDPFLNGVLIRVDTRAEAERPDDYRLDQALTDEDLVGLLRKSGMAFHSAVKKLDERNARRLKALIDLPDSEATVSQVQFLKTHLLTTYPPAPTTETNRAIQEEKGFNTL